MSDCEERSDVAISDIDNDYFSQSEIATLISSCPQ
jgi:hypothetical protein